MICSVESNKSALLTLNALSETKTAINYSTGTERSSYRREDMGGEDF